MSPSSNKRLKEAKFVKRRVVSLSLVVMLVVALFAQFAFAAEREYDFVIITHSATIDFWIPLVK